MAKTTKIHYEIEVQARNGQWWPMRKHDGEGITEEKFDTLDAAKERIAGERQWQIDYGQRDIYQKVRYVEYVITNEQRIFPDEVPKGC